MTLRSHTILPHFIQRCSYILTIVCVLAFSATAPVQAQALSDEQVKGVESVIQDYLLRNPEIIMQAISELRKREEAARAAHAGAALQANVEQLERAPGSPVAGNPGGDVTLIEFFDYRCGYCKKAFTDIQQLAEDDKGVRIVLKEFPILGEDSMAAAKASLAVWQGQPAKYMDFHGAMMTARGTLDRDKIWRLARKSGVDIKRMESDMESDAVKNEIEQNMKLAQMLNITGTPAFVAGRNVLPGAVGLETLKELIAAARTE